MSCFWSVFLNFQLQYYQVVFKLLTKFLVSFFVLRLLTRSAVQCIALHRHLSNVFSTVFFMLLKSFSNVINFICCPVVITDVDNLHFLLNVRIHRQSNDTSFCSQQKFKAVTFLCFAACLCPTKNIFEQVIFVSFSSSCSTSHESQVLYECILSTCLFLHSLFEQITWNQSKLILKTIGSVPKQKNCVLFSLNIRKMTIDHCFMVIHKSLNIKIYAAYQIKQTLSYLLSQASYQFEAFRF